MPGRIDIRIDPRDPSQRIDQIGNSGGIDGLGRLRGAIRQADAAILVAQQVVRKRELFLKGAVLGRRVEADADDERIPCGKFVDSITEPLAFDGSPRRVGFRIPPEHEMMAAHLLEADQRHLLIAQREGGRLIPYLQQRHEIPPKIPVCSSNVTEARRIWPTRRPRPGDRRPPRRPRPGCCRRRYHSAR